jgi:predicted transcriptional regulator
MSTITITISDAFAAELAEAGREAGRSPEAVAEEMIARMIALRKFERLRRDVREAFGEEAPKTDEEVFEQLS